MSIALVLWRDEGQKAKATKGARRRRHGKANGLFTRDRIGAASHFLKRTSTILAPWQCTYRCSQISHSAAIGVVGVVQFPALFKACPSAYALLHVLPRRKGREIGVEGTGERPI
ncbi:hypothetical protein GQ53DRAFT_745460 [Thozetella sp. PMI_491]|nr:hypothetical protein GQ53DRAFT_745460 [Thozetella sp. PMI_491]